MIRDDLSNKLIHLTKGTTEEGWKSFLGILKDGALKGGNGFIRSGDNCVCFTETPLAKLAQVLAQRQHRFRYQPFGVIVSKEWLFEHHGRPVIYQPEDEFGLLPDDLQYRHVRYEPPRIDFSWEREWRVKADQLMLNPEHASLVLPDRDWEERLTTNEIVDIKKREDGTPVFIIRPASTKWHYVVLEDLGVRIETEFP